MTTPASGLRLRHLSFTGPQREAASVTFGAGLNVLYGASDTGKSFIVEVIDFMLGGKPPLREFPERVGYDRILLGIETLQGSLYTIVRSVDGGAFLLYGGLHQTVPAEDVLPRTLAEQHSEKSEANLSSFLLSQCGLANKRVRKNARGETNSLSFRNIARLLIVTETEIMQQRSPLSDGNAVADTTNLSTFRLLLTGIDDSALVPSAQKEPEELSRDAQLELLDQLLGDYKDRLKDLTNSPGELEEQLERIDTSLSQHAAQLSATEGEFQQAATRRRLLRKKLEEAKDRRGEVSSLLERFTLLNRHYASDIERLRGIEEGGTLFGVLGAGACPLCGAESVHHRLHADCDGNTDAVVDAARKEIAKIELLQSELAVTIKDLQREGASFDRRLPSVTQELQDLAEQVDSYIAPKLAWLRTSYSTFADKRGEVREALSLLETIKDMERRRADLEKGQDDRAQPSVGQGDIPASVAEGFAQRVEDILKTWHFPEAGRVFFDAKTRDLVIAGKNRTARGKGLRAITHAAFTLGLLDFCRSGVTPHPGFVILDSPLLAYREPDGSEDDLTGTDLKEQFYTYLAELPEDRQVIIVENSDPPATIMDRPQVEMFSKNPHSGRYGLFPTVKSDAATQLL
jgi:hypothetical protein